MAFLNPAITAAAVEASEFPDLARRYRVTGVPNTTVNEAVEILGALPPDAVIEHAVSQLPTPTASDPTSLMGTRMASPKIEAAAVSAAISAMATTGVPNDSCTAPSAGCT